jgi:hypothetical protein
MTAAITTLRTTIATAIQDNTKYSTFAFPPATVVVNSCVISPADPYIEFNNNSKVTISPTANFGINIFVPLLDNEGNLNGIEEMVVAVVNKLAASSLSYNISSVTAPSVMSAASGDVLTSSINLSILSSWS